MEEVKRFFRPEFLNRVDAQTVFHPLEPNHILQIVDLMLNDIRKPLLEKALTLEVSQAAKDYLAEKGFDKQFGARPLRRVIQNEIEDALSDAVLAGKFQPGDTISVDAGDDDEGGHKLTFQTQSVSESTPTPEPTPS